VASTLPPDGRLDPRLESGKELKDKIYSIMIYVVPKTLESGKELKASFFGRTAS